MNIKQTQNQSLQYNINKNQTQRQFELSELQQLFGVTQIQEKVNPEIWDQYLITLMPDIQIRMLLNKDYPQSNAKFYVIQSMQHYLIDESTWQIRVDKKDSLKNMTIQIKYYFEQNRPQLDPFIQELLRIKTKIREEQIIQRIQQIDLKTIFKNVPISDYKKIVDGGKIMQYLEQLPEYQELTKYIIELAQANENFADHLLEQDTKLKHQKAELMSLANYFDKLRADVIEKERVYREVQSKLDPYHIVRQFDEQINQLDELSSEKIENLSSSVNMVEQNFQDELQSYLNLRKQTHKLQIKRDKLEETLLLQKQNMMRQQ